MNEFQSRCPVVKRTQEMLNQWVDVGGERQRVPFAKEVVWIQESESVLQFMHGGEMLKPGSINTDFYGYLTSCDDMSPSPEREAARYVVTQDSTLELRVQTTVYFRPAMETQDMAEHNQNLTEERLGRYADIPGEWRLESLDADGRKVWPMVARVELGSAVVWSSKNTEAENAALKAAFKDAWKIVGQCRDERLGLSTIRA